MFGGLFGGGKKDKKNNQGSENTNVNLKKAEENKKNLDNYIKPLLTDDDASFFIISNVAGFTGKAIKGTEPQIYENFCDLFLEAPETMEIIKRAMDDVKSGKVQPKLGRQRIENGEEMDGIVKKLLDDRRAKGDKVVGGGIFDSRTGKLTGLDGKEFDSVEDLLKSITGQDVTPGSMRIGIDGIEGISGSDTENTDNTNKTDNVSDKDISALMKKYRKDNGKDNKS